MGMAVYGPNTLEELGGSGATTDDFIYWVIWASKLRNPPDFKRSILRI